MEEEATPNSFLSTAPIIALLLGVENKPKPIPNNNSEPLMYVILESIDNSDSKKKLTITIIQPNVAIMRGCILSESLPDNGAIMAIETACSNTIWPAWEGLNPLIYCRYKLNKKANEKLLAYIKNDVDSDKLNTLLSENICTLINGRLLLLW